MDFVVFSDDYGRHPSSCQHLFNLISEKRKVLWVNTVGLRVPSISKGYDFKRSLEKIISWFHPLKKIHGNLYVLSPFMLPFQGNTFVNFINKYSVILNIRLFKKLLGFKDIITWTTVPNISDVAGKLRESLIIYNCTDDYSLWPGGNRDLILSQENNLLKKTDFVLASSESLVDHCKKINPNTYLYPHAVDLKHFSKSTRDHIPHELKPVPHPIIGFFGLLYEKINFNLIVKIARSYPDTSIVLIGKQGIDLSYLKNEKNIVLLGPVQFDELPSYAVHFDVGLMPYVLDDEIKKSAPLKLKEYLALGLPVVSVEVKDVKSYADFVYIARNNNDFIAKVRQALSEKNPDLRKARREAVKGETWEKRVESLEDILLNKYGIHL